MSITSCGVECRPFSAVFALCLIGFAVVSRAYKEHKKANTTLHALNDGGKSEHQAATHHTHKQKHKHEHTTRFIRGLRSTHGNPRVPRITIPVIEVLNYLSLTLAKRNSDAIAQVAPELGMQVVVATSDGLHEPAKEGVGLGGIATIDLEDQRLDGRVTNLVLLAVKPMLELPVGLSSCEWPRTICAGIPPWVVTRTSVTMTMM